MSQNADWQDRIRWDANGLVPTIAQEVGSNQILMVAWMNRESLARTVASGQAVYWSRSRNTLWHKGEESGHFQKVHQIRLDCDDDVLLLQVEQVGGLACHTGRHSCFFNELQVNDGAISWAEVEPVLKNPDDIYKK
ncbi:MAG: phosphoribosyl-AMP cyclohydrolase [Burkholderiaceae bacterium]